MIIVNYKQQHFDSIIGCIIALQNPGDSLIVKLYGWCAVSAIAYLNTYGCNIY